MKKALIAALTIVLFISLSFGQARNRNRSPGGNETRPPGIRGRVTESDRVPVTGAVVLIPELALSTKTDADGRFAFPEVSSGEGHIEIHAAGYLTYISDAFDFSKGAPGLNVTLFRIPSEEVVVTATRTAKMFAETPVKTEVITGASIENKDAANLASALALTTGVRVENNCQNCNFTQVRINGMEGKYSQVLIDSSPVMSAMTGVYGLEQIPAEMVDRIEIVKGAGSALYGGNAVAGVINVITKEPQVNSVDLKVRQEAIDGKPATNLGFHSGFVSKNMDTKVFLFADHQRREAVDIDRDGISELGRLNSSSFGANVYHDFEGIGGKLKMGFFHIHEERRGGDRLSLPPQETGITEWVKSDQLCLNASWDHSLSALTHYALGLSYMDARRETYYGSHQDPNAYGKTRNPLFHFSSQVNHQAGAHLLSFGVQYKRDKLKDEALGYGRIIDQTYGEGGVFLQDEWKPAAWATILGGLRLDKHSALDRVIVNPRASLLAGITKDLALRVSVSTGYRAPQVFDEDLHITQVGGEGLVIVNSPDLKEERALSLFAGLDYGRQWGDRLLQLSVEGFRTRVTDAFIFREIEAGDNSRVLQRINGSGAVVEGLSLNAGVMTGSGLNLSTGWTVQRSRLDSPEPEFGSRCFFRTPDVYGFVRLGGSVPSIADVEISFDYTGSMRVPHYAGYIGRDRLEQTKGMGVTNIRLKRNLLVTGEHCSLILGIFNVLNTMQQDLDKGIDRDSGYVYGPARPRTFYVGLDVGF